MENHQRMSEDLERVIMKDDTSSSMTTEEDPNLHQVRSFRERLCNLLHSHKFQVVIVCLVIFDCLLVISELLLDLRILELNEHNYEDPAHDSLVLCCQVLHYLSIAILSVFLVEIIAKIYAFRLEFFHHKLEMFDALVVVVSFSLDVAFRHNTTAVNGMGLLIILRLWRVTRILNGIVMSVKMQSERKLQRERCIKEALEQELAKFREYCAAQEQEIEALRALLRKHSITPETGYSGPRRPSLINTMDVVAEVNQINSEKNERNSTA